MKPGNRALRRHCGMLALLAACLTAPLAWASGPTRDVLAQVKARGHVRCGVDQSPGFSGFGERGEPRGFDIDFCRAVAAAALGDANAIRPERINTATKFKALVAGDIDIAFGMATWTYTRDSAYGTAFVAPTYYDGQGFMVWADSPHARPSTLKGASVCVQQGTTTAANLADFNQRQKLGLKPVLSGSTEDRTSRFVRRECEVVTGDRSELAALRIAKALDPRRWRLLDDTISREPLGPYVAAGDPRWFALVRWVVNVTQIAEQRGIGARNLAVVGPESDGELRRLAGLERDFGQPLGLDDAWARRVIEQVGNYGEIFDRHLGTDSPFKLERGPNQPSTAGGIFFPPPLR